MNINEQLRDIRLKIARGEFDAARTALLGNQALAEHAEAQALGARVLSHTDGYNLAHSMFLDLEAVWPNNFDVLKMHCQLMQEHGDYNAAIAQARQILTRFPTNLAAYEMLIDSYELAGKTADALQVIEQALAGFPGQTTLLERQMRLNQLFNRLDLNQQSIAELREELTYQPILPSDDNVNLILQMFNSREGVHAVQTKLGKNWGYIPERRDLSGEDIRQHLGGRKTVGIYVTAQNNTSRLMVMDLDVRKPWLAHYHQSPEQRNRLNELLKDSAKDLVSVCRMAGIQPLVESSGNKGLHFWFFSAEGFACRYWRTLGKWLLGKLRMVPEELSWEIFPKQDKVAEDGLGNLVKLPLGTHQKSGRRSHFVDLETFEPYPDPIKILQQTVRIDRNLLEKVLGAITVDNCRSDDVPRSRSNMEKRTGDTTATEYGTPRNNNLGRASDDQELAIDVKIPLPKRHVMEVEQVLSGCLPLWEIMEKARTQKMLTNDEKHVFIYVFALLGEEGRVFIHQVMNQLDGYQPDMINAVIRAVPPNPTGCQRIRKRLPELCRNTDDCNCQFRLPEGCYASPVIHAGIFPDGKGLLAGQTTSIAPANLSGKEMLGGESGGIDRMMQEFTDLCEEMDRLRARAALLRRQINRLFDAAGSDRIETRIRVYQRLPDETEPICLLL